MTTNHPIDKTLWEGTISKEIIIENNVWLGVNVSVISGVIIGENSIIGPGIVATKSISKNIIVAVIPARVIKEIWLCFI
ncbi:DapH/DapD/GlmU-related protein [Spiroplasma chrysopicola]|uniref:Acetyltransferase n=1 Tax=Spiroplasma chrysopicola DF-1 TaxID=1276227 RepID=R4UBA8_9MOLU|nr:DapH/DapD/GlmU-related protein [Spiroplasma chrysopicola]AGM25164.1 maltose O-acetyltransferase [Spiroplasma chrysopicola DF-1]